MMKARGMVWLSSIIMLDCTFALRVSFSSTMRRGCVILCEASSAYNPKVGPLPEQLENRLPLLKGPVAAGYGRGSRKLGIPTANLPSSLFQKDLTPLPCGVYVGWAGLRGNVHKCICNIGFSPTFEREENPEKIVEAHILDEFESDFYDEEMSLLLLGFVRHEQKFSTIDELLATINADIKTAKAALDNSPYIELRALLAAIPMDGEASFTMLDIPL